MPHRRFRRLRAFLSASKDHNPSSTSESRRPSTHDSTGPPRVHVLGLGAIGTFAAYSLSEIPKAVRPSITLLLHRPSLLEQYNANGSGISLTQTDGESDSHGNFDTEFLEGDTWCRRSVVAGPGPAAFQRISMQTVPIANLIVSVKAGKTVDALRPLKQRLDSSSTILLLQNGAGVVEELNQQLFTDERSRPRYIIGMISHGVTLNSPFNITQTGIGVTSLGILPQAGGETDCKDEESYLLMALPLAQRLKATNYPYSDVFQLQLEKLAANAFCNPLCALNDANNAFALSIPATRRALISEISQVIQSLPELRDQSDILDRFSVERLEMTVNDIIERTASATCSMVMDLRRGGETEIRYINGYWVRRGREVGVPTPLNEDLVERVCERSRRQKQKHS